MEPRGRGVFWTKQRPTDDEFLFLLSTPSFDTDIANPSHPSGPLLTRYGIVPASSVHGNWAERMPTTPYDSLTSSHREVDE